VIRQPFRVCGGGVWLLQETASAIRFGGIALVVAGIILLKGSAQVVARCAILW
jgi:multidrug transporter EmrE-like cation transporter